MLSDKITSFFFLKEKKVAFNGKKKNGYLKIFIHHYKNMFYIFKKKNISASSHLKKLYDI